MRLSFGSTSVALGLLLLAPPAMAADQLKVVTSFTILQDMVKEIGSNHVEASTLVGTDSDPHAFEPTPNDAKNLAAADLVIVSGRGLEGWMDRLIMASGYKGPIVIASTGVPERTMVDEEGEDSGEPGKVIPDPHAWNSVPNGKIYATNIIAALSKADPADAAYYQKAGEKYLQQLTDLDNWVRQEFATIPKDERKLITSHDALGYFADAYGLQFLAPAGLSTESEASAQDVAKLIQQIKAEKIKAVFVENSMNQLLVKQIADETGAKIGGTLYVESLSKGDGPAPTYVKMVRHNVTLMVAALHGQ
ncbi:metal ABC transporter substrate-binding protein [Dongia soli]|uniref:Metal ABC transporter substrate-binding protein n=1 Tax=Dongia soli TaxID=600628 RepID=A0ABU5EB10_9PROT|nr:metal ABC transporter substrate-binding protein [Dongia soli]MDY0883439.1 metal ABC transporter substrate-binding protein [Dongia soli]